MIRPRRIVAVAAVATALVPLAVTALGNSIQGSRHDLSGLNMRGYGVETGPMTGATFNDYKEICVYCHTPHNADDAARNTPKYHTIVDAGTHYKMDLEGSPGSDSCGKCHNRSEGAYGGIGRAHDASVRYLTRDLRDDHPFSIPFPSYGLDPGFNQPTVLKPDGGRMFPNGVQTFAGDKVQCASCHDPHDPDERNEEGRDPFLRTSNRESALCLTCHAK